MEKNYFIFSTLSPSPQSLCPPIPAFPVAGAIFDATVAGVLSGETHTYCVISYRYESSE